MRRWFPVIACLMPAMLLLTACPEEQPAPPNAAAPPVDTEPAGPVQLDVEPDIPERIAPRMDLRPGTNATHPIAGRSAFPELGEALTRPIPAKKLSEHSQFITPIDPASIPAVVPWQQAGHYVGYEITVQGTIIDTGQSRNGKVNFLNFHEDWRGKFYLVVFDDLAKTLPQSVDKTFRSKTLRVKGKVERYRGQPQLKITSMQQVEFVGE